MPLMACKPGSRRPNGPPKIDAKATRLATFEPASSTGPGTEGLAGARVVPNKPPTPVLPSPAIVDYGPMGEASSYPTIQIRFNRPMVALGADKADAPTNFEFTPAIEGKTYWAEPTRLVFEPDTALPDATRYTASFRGTIEMVETPALEVDLAWEFATAPPEAELWVDDDAQMGPNEGYHWNAGLFVDLEPDASLRELRRHVSAEATIGTGKPTPVEIRVRDHQGDESWVDFDIVPVDHWPAGARVAVRIDAELNTKTGSRPLSVPVVTHFDVVPGVEREELSCTEGRYDDGCELGPVVLRFTAPISSSQLRHIHVSPEPKKLELTLEDQDWDDGPVRDAFWEVELWGKFERHVDYRIGLSDRLRDVHGQALVNTKPVELRFVEPAPTLEVDAADFVRSRGATLGVESRHVKDIALRVAVLDEDQRTLWRGLGPDEAWPEGLAPTHEQTIRLDHSGAWGWSSHELDLSRFTKGKSGAVVYEVTATSLLQRARGRTMPAAVRGRVQISDLGVTVLGSVPRGVVRVARLSDDAPIPGAEIEVLTQQNIRLPLGVTDSEGLFELPEQNATELRLWVRHDDDIRELRYPRLPRQAGLDTNPSDDLRAGEHLQATLITERPLYRPGERVRAMGWGAIATAWELSNLRPLPAKAEVELQLYDHRGELVSGRKVRAKTHGKFWATLDIPERAALGDYELRGTVLGHALEPVSLSVKDFRTPEFEVSAAVTKTDLLPGESTTLRVDASYYFGGRVPIQSLRSVNNCKRMSYRPPGIEPSWTIGPRPYRQRAEYASPSLEVLGPRAREGHVEFEFVPNYSSNDVAWRCVSSVSVADATRQEVGAEAVTFVHPYFYLGVLAPSTFAQGEDAEIGVLTVDHEGTPRVGQAVAVTLERRWSERSYVTDAAGDSVFVGWEQKTETLPACKTTTGSDGRARCELQALPHGSYSLRATATDDSYQPEVAGSFYVRERGQRAIDRRAVEQLELSVPLTTNASAAVGDRLRVQIDAPWPSGRGMLVLAKGGIHEWHLFELDDKHAQVELTVTDAWTPGVELHVLAIEPGDANTLPKLHRDKLDLRVGAQARALSLAVATLDEARNGDRIPIDIDLRDAAGKPVAGHVSVWAVDEAVLSLAPLELPDFVAAFTVGLPTQIERADSYRGLMLPYAKRDDFYRPRVWGQAYGVGAGFGGRAKRVPRVRQAKAMSGSGGQGLGAARSKFSSAPIFIGDAVVGADGRAHLEGELPDNLTTFRITAIASAPLASGGVEARFGVGDTRIRVTRPLVARAALPRVLRPGDEAEIGVLVDNLQTSAGRVEVEVVLIDAKGVVEFAGLAKAKAKAKAKLAAGAQIRLPFTVRARGVGTAQIEVRTTLIGARGTRVSDAVRLPLPVEAERTLSERVATYGSLADEGVALLPFTLPNDADPRFGGLSVSVGSTLLGGLEDAVAYLVDYPHGCVEQTSSSLLPLIALGRLRDYPLGIGDVDDYVDAGVARLRSMGLSTGGFSYWPGGTTADPYAGTYATWVLHRAALAGYAVPPALLEGGLAHVRRSVAQWSAHADHAQGESIEAALMLMVLAERGGAPADALTLAFEQRRRLPIFAQALLVLALDAQARSDRIHDRRASELLDELRGRIDEREAVAKVETDSRWTSYWDTDNRSSALVLMAMLRVDPEHPLVSKLARGLLAARRGGRWSNTQENAYALVALADYAAIYEADEPAFDGRVWLGNAMLASVRVDGRGFAFEDAFTPMASLDPSPRGANQDLILERAGQGRMYYRVGLEWVSTAVDKPARAEGITIERALRNQYGLVAADQAIESGELLAVDVKIEIAAALDHMALEVPLPAGLEAIDLELGKGSAAMQISGQRGRWVSHQELRRDRAVVFADHLEPGIWTTTVFVRATTPGDYVMPAAQGEMMYYPEIHGRTTAQRVLVR